MSNKITLEMIYEKLVGLEKNVAELKSTSDRVDHNLANLALNMNGNLPELDG